MKYVTGYHHGFINEGGMMTKKTTKTDALIDDLLKDYRSPEDLLGEHGLLERLTKRLVKRALASEITSHLVYALHAFTNSHKGNTRNGTHVNIETNQCPVELTVQRDRAGTFEPTVVKKRQQRVEGLDDKALVLRGGPTSLGRFAEKLSCN